jgi:hypothetical protein
MQNPLRGAVRHAEPVQNLVRTIAGSIEPQIYSAELHNAIRREVPSIDETLEFLERTRLVKLIGIASYDMPNPSTLDLTFMGFAPDVSVRPYNSHYLRALERRMYGLGFPEQTRFWLSKQKKEGLFRIDINPRNEIALPGGIALAINLPKKEKHAEKMRSLVTSPETDYRNYLLAPVQLPSEAASLSEQ